MKVKYKDKTSNLHIILEEQWEIDLLTALIGATSDSVAYKFGKPTSFQQRDVLYDVFKALDCYSGQRENSLSITLEK